MHRKGKREEAGICTYLIGYNEHLQMYLHPDPRSRAIVAARSRTSFSSLPERANVLVLRTTQSRMREMSVTEGSVTLKNGIVTVQQQERLDGMFRPTCCSYPAADFSSIIIYSHRRAVYSCLSLVRKENAPPSLPKCRKSYRHRANPRASCVSYAWQTGE